MVAAAEGKNCWSGKERERRGDEQTASFNYQSIGRLVVASARTNEMIKEWRTQSNFVTMLKLDENELNFDGSKYQKCNAMFFFGQSKKTRMPNDKNIQSA